MHKDINTLYNTLKISIDQNRLKEISADIISDYRKKNIQALSWFSTLLDLQSKDLNSNRLFSAIIQVYHPDKLLIIQNEIDSHYKNNSLEELIRIKNIYLFNDSDRKQIAEYHYGKEDTGESYEYNESDFGYAENNVNEESFSNDYFEESPFADTENSENGFIEAIKKSLFGNLDITINSHELQELEGEINLSNYGIIDLDGIEYSYSVTSIILSGNRIEKIDRLSGLMQLEYLFLSENEIENIDCLADLTNLKELDLSFNEIEDISVLLVLESLNYVNLIGNPVKDDSVIQELTEKGVVVLI